MRESRLSQELKGRLYPGTASKVREITVRGNTRFVHLADGQILKETKASALKKFQEVMKGDSFDSAKRSIRTTESGKVKMTVGGERIEYTTKARALAALNRRYGK